MTGVSTVGRTGIDACRDHVRPSLLFGALKAGSLKQEKELRHELQEAPRLASGSVTLELRARSPGQVGRQTV